MNIRDYEYIVTIAEQGSISRAANQLYITQPALTKFLQRTEAEVGTALFLRKGNQFLLTEVGRKYVETGHEIMKLDRKLTRDIGHAVESKNRSIGIGYGMGRSAHIIDDILPQFFAEYPEVKVKANAETSRRQMEHLEAGELDLALISGLERRPGFRYMAVAKSKLVLAVRKGAAIVNQAVRKEGYDYPVIADEAWKHMPLICMDLQTNSGTIVKEYLDNRGLDVHVALEVKDARSMMDAVEGGLGAALFLSVPKGRHELTYLSLEGAAEAEFQVYLVMRADSSISEPMQYMMDLIMGQ